MKRRLQIQYIVGSLAITALTVSIFGCASFDNMRGDTQYGADHHLRNQVQDALHHDPTYKYPEVTVTCERGQIQLSGYINTEDQRHYAMKDASAVPGVLGVTDNMIMTTNAPVVPENNP
jgi:hyperosmotically inducible periplasmic protein